MVDWQIYAGPSTAVPTAELTTARERKLSFKLSEPSTCSFNIDGRQGESLSLLPLATDVHATRNGTVLFTGRQGGTTDEINRDDHTVTVNAVDYRGLLARRLTQTARSYAGTDITTVLADMLTDAQADATFTNSAGLAQGAGGRLGISIPATWKAGASGVVVSRSSAAGVPVWEEILAVMGGDTTKASTFDFDLVPGWPGSRADARTAQVWTPARGRDLTSGETAVVLEYRHDPMSPLSSPLAAGRRVLDPATFANVLVGSGGTKTISTTMSAATVAITRGEQAYVSAIEETAATAPGDPPPDPTVSLTYYTTPVTRGDGATAWQVGIYATREDYPDIYVQAELAAKVASRLAELSVYSPSWTAQLRRGFWGGPEHLWLGDTVRLKVDSGRLDDDVRLRITQIDITAGPDGDEDVALTVGTAGPATPVTAMLEQARQIAVLRRAATR